MRRMTCPKLGCNKPPLCMPRRGLADQGRSGRVLAFLGPISQRSITMMRVVTAALAVSSVAALQPPLASKAAAAKANPAAVDLYSRATATSAARDVALYGMFGPSEAEKRAEQARGGVRSDDPYTPPRRRRDTRRRASTPNKKH